jgi:hypothetical protein
LQREFHRKDEVGKTYGRLTVLEYAGVMPDRGGALWNCKCECGNEYTAWGVSLRSGNTKSCGCFQRDAAAARLSKAPGYAATNRAIESIQGNARKRRIAWHLTRDQAADLLGQNCFYCNVEPLQVARSINETLLYNGIDRLDSAIGYVSGNVVPCCGTCNRAKGSMTLAEFEAWLRRLHTYFIQKRQ